MSNPQSSISIRDIEELSELRAVEELQKEVWGVDDREVFPALALIPMREVGGILVGAFDGDRMIGFVFAFPGCEHGRAILHSDMLAVKPAYRSHGLGYKLKLAQRERALAKGIDIITWTFDPLQSLNAHLNISKLGAIADSYRVNYYGETTSFLHRTGTDRLWATWMLSSERVKLRIADATRSRPPALNDILTMVRVGENEEPISSDDKISDLQSVAIAVPNNINAMFRENVELAARWRQATRRAFIAAMAAGFFVEDFHRVERTGQNRGAYLLRKKD